jgi:hypothetical protein
VRSQDKRELVDKHWAKLSSENHVCFETLHQDHVTIISRSSSSRFITMITSS